MDAESVAPHRARALPAWHPLALVALMLAVAVAGGLSLGTRAPAASPSRSPILLAYVPMLIVSWGLLLYVCRVCRPRWALAELVGFEGYSARRTIIDVSLAAGVTCLLLSGELGWRLAFGNAPNVAVARLLPSTPAERAVWCLVAASAAFSEEVVYRGYLTTELVRLTRRPTLGIVGQAVLFALAHGEQGAGVMARFFVYAVGLALLARVRRSLVPGIVAHAAVDLLAGFSR